MLDTMNWRGRIDVLDLITIWLLTEHEKGDKSDFIGYLKSLPLTSTCPLAVPEELWSLLPNQTRIELEKDKLDFETRFERVQRVVKSSYVSTISKLTLPMFRWAYWVIRSRWVACWDYDLRNMNRQWLQLGTDKDRVWHHKTMKSDNDFDNACHVTKKTMTTKFQTINDSDNSLVTRQWQQFFLAFGDNSCQTTIVVTWQQKTRPFKKWQWQLVVTDNDNTSLSVTLNPG